MLWWATVLAAAMTVGGCSSRAVELDTAADFERTVQSDRPVLVMFWKWGCAACYSLDPCIDNLAAEYAGRATVAKLMILNLVFVSPVPEIQSRYEIYLVPTVILFVNGQEKERWTMNYNQASYKRALNAVVGPPVQAASLPPGHPAAGLSARTP